jgi:hypothetical protein
VPEVRCPSCGKRNPSGHETCQYCQAPLKPARGSPPPFKDADSVEPASSLPDWLRELGLTDPASQEAGEIEQAKPLDAAGLESTSPGEPAEQEDLTAEASPDTPIGEEHTPSEPVLFEDTAPPGGQPPVLSDEGGSPEPAPDQEEAGPLAGLAGLLSADSSQSRLPGQATRPLHLKITANQRLHADLLRSLVEMEGQPRPLPKHPKLSSQRAQRWVIALVLILAVLWPLMKQGSPASLETAYTEEVAELNRLVSQLSPEAKVLVAFDYEPAFAPEIEAAAAPVLDHLMLQGASLAFVSTTPLGPVLAERFMEGPLAIHQYTRGDQYINLGFIPGGAAGLLSLVESPKSTVPYTIEGVAAWGTDQAPALPPLEGVHSLEDFSLVLVLVDDPDLARVWIEQVSPRQGEQVNPITLVMVTSAQAEALLQPYYQSNPRQLHGFASGLRGGVAYTLMTGRERGIQEYWDAFGVGLFVIAVVLVIGAVLHASTLPAQTTPAEKGEGRP